MIFRFDDLRSFISLTYELGIEPFLIPQSSVGWGLYQLFTGKKPVKPFEWLTGIIVLRVITVRVFENRGER